MMDTLGAVVGPVLALGLLSLVGGDLRRVMLLAAIPGFIGALLVLTVSDPRRRRKPHEAASCEAASHEAASHEEQAARTAGAPAVRDQCEAIDAVTGRLRWTAIPSGFRQYLGAWLPFVLVNSSDVFLILRAKQLGFSTTAVILVYALYNLAYALASLPLGHLSDRLGRRGVLAVGMIVFAAVYAGFSVANRTWHVIALFAVYGLYMAATDGVGKAFAMDLVPRELRATAIGLLGTVTGVATLAASSIAGVLWDTVDPRAPFLFGAAGAIASAALFICLPGLKKRRQLERA